MNLGSTCIFRSWKKVFQTFFEDNKKAITVLETAGKRYGLEAMSTDKVGWLLSRICGPVPHL